jgi:hypothetical protein
MTFTRVFVQLMRREKQCMGFKLHSTEKLKVNSEEGYKIQKVICLLFKQKTDAKDGREGALTHKVTQQGRHREKPEKMQFWKVCWPKRGWRSVAKGKERYITMCKAMRECWHSVNTGTGAPGSKTPKNVKKLQKLQFKLDNYAKYDG